jgi:hypothetical protein
VEEKNFIMDITKFNKELGIKIAVAKRFENKGDIKAAIFKNMIINRTKGIFAHIKGLKAAQSKDDTYIEDLTSYEVETEVESKPEITQIDDTFTQDGQINDGAVINGEINGESEVIKDSEFKDLPKGFKEIKTSDNFTIITPHDEDFVKKQRAKVEESEMFKPKKQLPSEEDSKSKYRIDFEQPKDGKSLICFACGFDKNAPDDIVCKNCGTDLN